LAVSLRFSAIGEKTMSSPFDPSQRISFISIKSIMPSKEPSLKIGSCTAMAFTPNFFFTSSRTKKKSAPALSILFT
jgi:hypothetical protein